MNENLDAAVVSSMAGQADDPQYGEASIDLAHLGDALSQSGFGEYFACFEPLKPRQAHWDLYRQTVPARLGPLVDLFMLNRPVARDLLPEDIGCLVPGLIRSGIAAGQGEDVWLRDGLVLLPVVGRWLFCQPPNSNPTFYFGDDSVGLLTRILPRADGTCLDLCTGPGLLALHSAGIAKHVTAVEFDSASAALARLNVSLNRLSSRIDILQGDLFEPVRGRRFDTITANPPMLPYPEGLAGPLIGHGGTDGLQVTRRILAELPRALASAGTAQIIGTCLSDGAAPMILEALRAEAEAQAMDLTVSILSHRSVTHGPRWEAVVATLVVISKSNAVQVRAAYADMLARVQATHLCSLYIHASHGKGRFDLLDMAGMNDHGPWYVASSSPG